MSVRSSSSVSTLDGLRVETVRHQWDDVLRHDEMLGVGEDDEVLFLNRWGRCVEVNEINRPRGQCLNGERARGI